MKVPSARRSSSDATTHFSPYPPPTSTSSAHPILFTHPSSSSSSSSVAHPQSTSPRKSSSTSLTATPSLSHTTLPPPSTSISERNNESLAPQQYKVARAISSCTRCRSRKQKCDGKLPACSACERAKVECIGFDAISKTNVSRNYLHSLEQEVASLRAQVAALSSTNADPVGQHKREIAANASQAVALFHRDISIDPTLQGPEGETLPNSANSTRSPWDTPGSAFSRRHSDFPFPPTPRQHPDSPRSPNVSHRANPYNGAGASNLGTPATSLTRMVQDAALRTGHASLHPGASTPTTAAAVLNPIGGGNGPPSVAGSVRAGESPSSALSKESPVGSGIVEPLKPEHVDHTSPEVVLTPNSIPTTGVPRGPPSTSSVVGGSSSSGRSRTRRLFSVPPLPPQPAVERLIAAYVDFVGVTAPMIHIPTLGNQLKRMREGVEVEQSDIFTVMMVLALSTMASSRFVEPPDELRACSEAFHAEALKHLDAVFEAQSYIGLQAILLLVWYALLNPDKGSIWFLVGLATRTCVDLGLHNEHNVNVESLDNLEVDMRRRLFWITYKVDRLLSLSLGRPPSIPDGFTFVPMPAILHDVDIHSGDYGPLNGEPCSYKAIFLHTIRLRQLQSEILSNTYGVNGLEPPKPEWFDDMFGRLKDWLATTPEPRGTVSREGYAISFHNSCLLLFRPSRGNPRPGRSALATILASSSYIIRIYRRMQLNNRISWLWVTSHFSFMAGLSFLYAFFNLYSLGGGAGVPTLDEAMMDIESCLGVLEFLSARVPSASACHETMRNVSQAIIEQLSNIHPRPDIINDEPGRFRGAPISSSRDDPHPNDTFPAPLPPVTLPYELTMLDNLFLNPMAAHSKASDYTNGPKNKASKMSHHRSYGANGSMDATTHSGGSSAPQGLPPSAFHYDPTTMANGTGLGPYGIAAQLHMPSGASPFSMFRLNRNGGGGGAGTSVNDDPTLTAYRTGVTTGEGLHAMNGGLQGMANGVNGTFGTGFDVSGNVSRMISGEGYDGGASSSLGSGVGAGGLGVSIGGGGGDAGGIGTGTSAGGPGASGTSTGGALGGNSGAGATGGWNPDPSFDIFSFLMDEEGVLGGTTTWDALDVPSDYPLWS